MDHQIEHDVDVGPPSRERAESMGFNEPRIVNEPLQGSQGPVEPFQMADLQDEPPRFCQPDQSSASSRVFVMGFSRRTSIPWRKKSLAIEW